MNKELAKIINDALGFYSVKEVAETIALNNMWGNQNRFINSSNCHLFRQFRNKVSANPETLIHQAIQA